MRKLVSVWLTLMLFASLSYQQQKNVLITFEKIVQRWFHLWIRTWSTLYSSYFHPFWT